MRACSVQESQAGIKNIQAVLRQASPADVANGLTWYRRYRSEAIRCLKLGTKRSIGLAAVWSQQRPPGLALRQIRSWLDGSDGEHTSDVLGKAERILWGG